MSSIITTTDIQSVRAYLVELQQEIIQTLEDFDGKAKFTVDAWERAEGGGGQTAVLFHGNTFEQAGVNFSHVMGESLPASATQQRPELAGARFEAMGVSLVLHPWNPYVPTTHMNVRLFTAKQGTADSVWWFGGGFDLTPYYGFEEDCIHWHQQAKNACAPFGPTIYPQLKAWCDRYFYLPHRSEPRGIGGVFFDDWKEGGFPASFGLMRAVGDHFLKAYMPILQRRAMQAYGASERAFQCYRRGRYVEFNLLYDRGTHFGLQSRGRTPSILMSLPPEVSFRYHWEDLPHSPEAALLTHFLTARDWLA